MVYVFRVEYAPDRPKHFAIFKMVGNVGLNRTGFVGVLPKRFVQQSPS